MFRSLIPLALASLLACSGDKPTEDSAAPDTETETPPPVTDSGTRPPVELTGNFGSVYLVESQADAYYGVYTTAFAIFTDDDGGYESLALCLWSGTCLESLPAAGETVVPEFTDLYAYEYFEVDELVINGASIGDESQPIDYYIGSPPFDGDGSMSFDGDFAAFSGAGLFTVPDPIVVTSPDPAARLELGPGGTIDLVWTPGGAGDVYLQWSEGFARLEDDGSETFAAADLALGDTVPFDFEFLSLSRVVVSEFDAAGNTVDVFARSEQILFVDYVDLTGWTELQPDVSIAETCEGAIALAPLAVAGQYVGDTGPAADDLDLGEGNEWTGYPTLGNDLFVPFTLLAGQTLTAEYSNPADGSIYLFDGGCLDANLVDGSDVTFYGDVETVSYTAAADTTIVIGCDSYFYGGGDFTLVVTID